MSEFTPSSPFVKSNPLYDVATQQHFTREEIQFGPIIEVLELLFNRIAFGNFFVNVIDFRDFTYPYFTSTAYEVVGYSSDHFKDLNTWIPVVHPDDLKSFLDYGARAVTEINLLPAHKKQKAVINICYRVFHGTRKEYIWFYQQGHISYVDKNGSIVYVITFNSDVTHLMNSRARPSWSVVERSDNGDYIYLSGSELHDSRNPVKRLVLSKRETEVINLSARGFSTPEIAKQLMIGHRSVISYKKKILVKTNSRNMSEAVSSAVNLGYL